MLENVNVDSGSYGGDVWRRLGMTSAGPSLSLGAFAAPDAGNDYLATAEHYRYLARGVVDALHRGCLVLVTGDPPANPSMLAEALTKAAAPRAVIEIPCGPELTREQLSGHGSTGPGAPTSSDGPAKEANGAALPSSILFLADADRLSDDQIADIFEAAQAAAPEQEMPAATVLVAHSSFLARFEDPELHRLEESLAGHLRAQQLERDEVPVFIRHQLPPGEGADLFTGQRMALIAITSGGDPAVVNRLARRMLETVPDGSAGGLRAKLSRAWRSLRLPVGIIIGLGALWLVTAALAPQDLGALVSLVRDHIFPDKTPAGAAAPVAAIPEPAAAAGSSSAAPLATPPSAVSSPQPTPESVPRPASAAPPLSATEIAALVERGDAFLAAGDIASARLFFERAADAGDGRAAMRMAFTFDAAFLERAGLRSLRNDPERAAFWYRRARDLGIGKAEPPLGGDETSRSAEPLRPR
jgi:hypothetical protein